MPKKEAYRGSVFDRFETRIEDFSRKKGTEEEEALKQEPHVLRLGKGAIPYREAVTPYQRFCRRLLSKQTQRLVLKDSKLEMDLAKAHMKISAPDYLAFVWMSTVLSVAGGVIGVIALGVVAALMGNKWPLPTVLMVILDILLLMIPLFVYMGLSALPGSTASSRGKDIDKKIAHAMTFVSTLASADVNVDVIFNELSKQVIYGEIHNEAQWITRDVELMGKDILTAVRDAANRTPSTKFQDFLQGVITTTLSGGQLKPYFVLKAEQFTRLAKLDAKKNMETLGMLAESFVTVVVAMPLFLIVMMSLMGLVGSSAGSSVLFLYLVVYVMIPMSQVGFIVAIKSIAEET